MALTLTNLIHTFRLVEEEYLRRIRRPKKGLLDLEPMQNLFQPQNRAKIALQDKKDKKEINIGEAIAPKFLTNTSNNKDGNLEEKTQQIYSRKIPLREIILEENERLFEAGVLKIRTDEEYNKMTNEQIIMQLEKLEIKHNMLSEQEAKDLLKTKERTRKIKMWHDHTSILNRSYVHFMVSYIYDPANFFTEQEYREKFPHKKLINIQSIVERPNCYIFGQSGKI